MADELEARLRAAVASGGDVADVVGSDPIRYAATWAQQASRRPWVERALAAVSVLTLSGGCLALLGPATGDGPTGIDGFGVLILVAVTASSLGAGLLQMLRPRLTALQAAATGAAGVLVLAVALAIVGPPRDADRIVLHLEPEAAAGLIAAGLVGSGALWLVRRA